MIKLLKQAGKLVLYMLLLVPAMSFLVKHTQPPKKGIEFPVHKILSQSPGNFSLLDLLALYSIKLADDSVPFNFIKKDQRNVNRYVIIGTLFKSNDRISLFLRDSLILNYKKWNLSSGNRIDYSPEKISAVNFSLSSDSAIITLVNDSTTAGVVNITLRNIDLKDIAGLLNQDTLTASGLLNAAIRVNGFGKKIPAFTGNASVDNLQLMQQPVGNLQLSGVLVNDRTIHARLALNGNGNDLSVTGNFFLNNGLRQLDALLDIKKLQASVISAFFKTRLSRASGTINGLLTWKGKFKQPEWTGTLNFDSARFTANQFGTTYFIDRQKIAFNHPAINFNDFTIKDSLDHSLVLNGSLRSTSLYTYDIKMTIDSRRFNLIDAPKAINNQLYGYAEADAKLTVIGTTAKPLIAGNVRFNPNTDVTLVLPEKNADKDVAGSVVKFIRRDTFSFQEKENFRKPAEARKDLKNVLNNRLNFYADNQSALTIVIDPSTGDNLRVKGAMQFNAGKEPGQKGILSGIYRIDSGYYELNYQFAKKRFTVLSGSTIDFNGDPADATINIRAEYIGNTAPKDLLGNEIGTIDPKVARLFNTPIPFQVVLFLKGSLNKPAISFDIRLPDGIDIIRPLRATIDNKLVQLRADVAATNKEVFALLALGRFVGEQSTDFFKGNGSDFSDINKESVSQFLSAALDRLASDLFKGINIDLNLKSYKDFTSNDGTQKTDLNVEVSKNFLDDRLSVTVGKNFGIETLDASTKASQQKASRFLPDVTVNYKLSSDGKYMIRAYNKNPFEVVMDGYIVETGLAFMIIMDYEKYEELIIKKSEKKSVK